MFRKLPGGDLEVGQVHKAPRGPTPAPAPGGPDNKHSYFITVQPGGDKAFMCILSCVVDVLCPEKGR